MPWNALFASAGALTEDGWTAEQYRSIREACVIQRPGWNENPMRSGPAVQRAILGKNESAVSWPGQPRRSGFLRQLGQVEGMPRCLRTSRNLELQPTVTAVRTSRRRRQRRCVETSRVAEADLSMKYGLGTEPHPRLHRQPGLLAGGIRPRPDQDRPSAFRCSCPSNGEVLHRGPGKLNVQAPGRRPAHQDHRQSARRREEITGKLGARSYRSSWPTTRRRGSSTIRLNPATASRRRFVVAPRPAGTFGRLLIGVITTRSELRGCLQWTGRIDGQFHIGSTFGCRPSPWPPATATLKAGAEAAGTTSRRRLNARGAASVTGCHARWWILDSAPTWASSTNRRSIHGGVNQYAWWPESSVTTWGPRFRYERNRRRRGRRPPDATASFGASAQFAANMTADLAINRDLEISYEGVDFHPNR